MPDLSHFTGGDDFHRDVGGMLGNKIFGIVPDCTEM